MNPSRVAQQPSPIVIIIMGMATPVSVRTAEAGRVNASLAPRTRAGGSRTRRATLASRDRRPCGGAAGAAGMGGVPPPRQAGSQTATSTTSAVPAAIATSGPEESGTATVSESA
jgi:hypothetical protein